MASTDIAQDMQYSSAVQQPGRRSVPHHDSARGAAGGASTGLRLFALVLLTPSSDVWIPGPAKSRIEYGRGLVLETPASAPPSWASVIHASSRCPARSAIISAKERTWSARARKLVMFGGDSSTGVGDLTAADDVWRMFRAVGTGDSEFWRPFDNSDLRTLSENLPLVMLGSVTRGLTEELFPQRPSAEEIDRVFAKAAQSEPGAASVLTAEYVRVRVEAVFGDGKSTVLALGLGALEQAAAFVVLLIRALGLPDERVRSVLAQFEAFLIAAQHPDHPAHDELMDMWNTVAGIARQRRPYNATDGAEWIEPLRED
jgi:hypothetical protein